jgi:uncharacterized protein
MKTRTLILALLFLLTIAGNIHAASFDCGKATSEVEKLICGEPGLSQLDVRLSNAYRDVLRHTAHDPADLKREQTKWLREVRNRCTDSACVEEAYRNRLATLEKLLLGMKGGEKSVAPAETLVAQLRIIKEISDYRPAEYPIRPYDGRLFFSQFDQSGNNFDILALDIEDLSCEYILRGRPGAQFVAQNENYLVVSEEGRFAHPLVAIDRATNKHVKQIKLWRRISWAKIKGNRLITIQGDWLGGGYAIEAEALIFELPGLKVIRSVKITAGSDVQSWQGKIVVLSQKREVVAYDDDFNEVFKIALPAQKNVEGYICHPHTLRIYGDKAVVVHNCGEILIYDLPTGRLEHTIPPYAQFYALAIVDGLIFTAPMIEPKQKNSAHVYDLYTGKELAVLPINARHLFAKGNRLLAVEPKLTEPSVATLNLLDMTLYLVDASALRNGKWRVEQVLKECRKARGLLVDSGDLYGAIDLCKLAGIEGLVEDPNKSESIISATKGYALWLSKTLDRSRNAVRILEALQKIAPDEEINRGLVEARLKMRVLEGDEVDALTAEEQQTDFARILDIGNHLKGAKTRNIDFGAFSNLFHFSGNRIYVGRYRGGASIGVLDRNTFKEIASIPIALHDKDHESPISSITSDNNRIYVAIGYDNEQSDRPDFLIIDKASLKILKKAQIGAPSTLVVESGQLLACDCDPVHQQRCVLIDRVTAKTVEIPDKVCIEAGNYGDCTVVHLPSGRADNARLIAFTKDYLVAHRHTHAPYMFYPRAPDGKPISVQLSPHDLLDRPIATSGNEILISEGTRENQIFKLVSVPTGVIKTLFGLLTSVSRSPIPHPLLHDKTLFVGLGRDLIVFDIKNSVLKRYVKDLIPAGLKDKGHGLATNCIEGLMIDQGRLIALTSRGENCQIVPLSSLVALTDRPRENDNE